ncbi:hypothetical protein GCM10020221_19350 [Streptomyces thioluteus]|uniref:Uncharacterized protein n=1 Tax=Streptomyces thioluteus TaxID=66431 RepID=A0ABN3WP64_STRTU
MPVVWSMRMSSGASWGVGEAAVRLVELHGGDAEVEEDALDLGDAEALQHLRQLVVDGLHQGGAVPEGGEPLAGQLQGRGVAVEGDEPHVGEGLQQRLAVPAGAQGAVDDDGPPVRRWRERACPDTAGA